MVEAVKLHLEGVEALMLLEEEDLLLLA